MSYPDCILIDCDQLKRILSYDSETGEFRWIIPPYNHPRMKGMIAGCKVSGYTKIQIGKKKYAAHRLAWFFQYGKWPAMVDHINRNPYDNRIANLRECTQAENARNHSRRLNKSGLPTGVRLIRSSGNYQARVSFNGIQIHLGSYPTPELAESVYKSKRAELYKEFTPS